MIYFTADQHFGHDAIIDHCKRPFRNAAIMDKVIIKNHNNIVSDDDDVYIIGDFSIKTEIHKGTIASYVHKMKGRLHLIMGNHDIKNPWIYIDVGFKTVHAPYLEVEEFVVAHDPALSQVDRSRWFLCGHVHDLFHILKNCVNVGVDVNGFKPLSIEEVRIMIEQHGRIGKE